MTRTIINFIKSFRYSKHHHETRKSKKELTLDECVVCLETDRCLTTTRCNHPICVGCLGTYINVTHHSRMPCPCPASAICKQKFTIEDITPYVDEEQIRAIWLVQAAKQVEAGRGMYCPNDTCSKPVLWTAKKLKKSKGAGKCRSCNQPICMRCRTVYHHSMTYPPPSGPSLTVAAQNIKGYRLKIEIEAISRYSHWLGRTDGAGVLAAQSWF